jgi:hypothetical protein
MNPIDDAPAAADADAPHNEGAPAAAGQPNPGAQQDEGAPAAVEQPSADAQQDAAGQPDADAQQDAAGQPDADEDADAWQFDADYDEFAVSEGGPREAVLAAWMIQSQHPIGATVMRVRGGLSANPYREPATAEDSHEYEPNEREPTDNCSVFRRKQLEEVLIPDLAGIVASHLRRPHHGRIVSFPVARHGQVHTIAFMQLKRPCQQPVFSFPATVRDLWHQRGIRRRYAVETGRAIAPECLSVRTTALTCCVVQMYSKTTPTTQQAFDYVLDNGADWLPAVCGFSVYGLHDLRFNMTIQVTRPDGALLLLTRDSVTQPDGECTVLVEGSWVPENTKLLIKLPDDIAEAAYEITEQALSLMRNDMTIIRPDNLDDPQYEYRGPAPLPDAVKPEGSEEPAHAAESEEYRKPADRDETHDGDYMDPLPGGGRKRKADSTDALQKALKTS